MNRVGLGLAVGAGYLLGRTKKLKLAVAVGTMVAGKKMNLTPRGIADLVTTQLQNNPQFKEIGDQLREDMRGVGKAATGALVERRIEAFADRLHGRTSQVRDEISGVASKVPGTGSGDRDEDAYDEHDEHDDGDDREDYADDGDERDEREDRAAERSERRPRRRGGRDDADEPEKKAPAKRTAARKTAAKKAPARRTAAKSAQSARKTAQGTARGTRRRTPKGGDE
ncbi:DNA primase [Streptomyces sp. NPDC000134]|uniref:DNA primase n=1 Tax=Streptomyces sp. NPDC000134 TaxID=3364536 RepID=UPI0036967878